MYTPPSSHTNLEEALACIHNSHETIVMGDMNCRVGNYYPTHINTKRVSKDKMTNAKGKQLIQTLNTTDMVIMNGYSESDSAWESSHS
jgi:hypothetical protein